MKLQILDYENQLSTLRRHNDDLDTQIKSGQAKLTTHENDLITSQKETVRLNELNSRLQREKQDAMKFACISNNQERESGRNLISD